MNRVAFFIVSSASALVGAARAFSGAPAAAKAAAAVAMRRRRESGLSGMRNSGWRGAAIGREGRRMADAWFPPGPSAGPAVLWRRLSATLLPVSYLDHPFFWRRRPGRDSAPRGAGKALIASGLRLKAGRRRPGVRQGDALSVGRGSAKTSPLGFEATPPRLSRQRATLSCWGTGRRPRVSPRDPGAFSFRRGASPGVLTL